MCQISGVTPGGGGGPEGPGNDPYPAPVHVSTIYLIHTLTHINILKRGKVFLYQQAEEVHNHLKENGTLTNAIRHKLVCFP